MGVSANGLYECISWVSKHPHSAVAPMNESLKLPAPGAVDSSFLFRITACGWECSSCKTCLAFPKSSAWRMWLISVMDIYIYIYYYIDGYLWYPASFGKHLGGQSRVSSEDSWRFLHHPVAICCDTSWTCPYMSHISQHFTHIYWQCASVHLRDYGSWLPRHLAGPKDRKDLL